jgi:small-conductance mechanosensitive channel
LLVGRYVAQPVIDQIVRRRNRQSQTIQEAISRYVQLVVVVVAVFVGVAFAGYGQFLTNSALVIAALTLAVGVAGQSVIGSLISGLVLVFDPEFNVGDYIVWENSEGTVRSITLRITRVQTPNGEMVTIPNTVLTSQAITRPYNGGRSRVSERVGLAYEADEDEAMAILSEVARDQESIVQAPSPDVYVDEFGDDAVLIRIHYWIEDPQPNDIFKVRSTYAREVKTRLEAAGIEISPASKRELRGHIEVSETA